VRTISPCILLPRVRKAAINDRRAYETALASNIASALSCQRRVLEDMLQRCGTGPPDGAALLKEAQREQGELAHILVCV